MWIACVFFGTLCEKADRYHNGKKSGVLWKIRCLTLQKFIIVGCSWVTGAQKALIVLPKLSVLVPALTIPVMCQSSTFYILKSSSYQEINNFSMRSVFQSICAVQIFKSLVLSIKFSTLSPKTLFVWEQICSVLNIRFAKQSGNFFWENMWFLLDRIRKYKGG